MSCSQEYSAVARLHGLVDMGDPYRVLEEVQGILRLSSPSLEGSDGNLAPAFRDTVALFEGRFPGYRACNTEYHDLRHSTETLLAMVRLIDGAVLAGHRFTAHAVFLALLAALLHDAGYIQKDDDTEGTGAKYTAVHIRRSIEFMQLYCREQGFSERDIQTCADILSCTGLEVHISRIAFVSPEAETLGKALGVADLLGQMSDQDYLAKLPELYREFREGGIDMFADEWELLSQTPAFYLATKQRFATELGGVDQVMINHFRERLGIGVDLYAAAIQENIERLRTIVREHPADYRERLGVA